MMARRFLDDVRAEITNDLADNTTGNITPGIMRQILTDVVDSTISDESLIRGSTQVVSFALTSAFTALTTGIYTSAAGGDGNFLTTNIADGNITTSPTAGFTYSVEAAVTIEAANNNIIEAAILINGSPGAYTPAVTGGGLSGRPVSIYVTAFVNGAASLANTVIQIGLRAPDGATNINIDEVILGVSVLPTNDPN